MFVGLSRLRWWSERPISTELVSRRHTIHQCNSATRAHPTPTVEPHLDRVWNEALMSWLPGLPGREVRCRRTRALSRGIPKWV
jgi:hypothetical protein